MDPLKKVVALEPAKKAFSLAEEFKTFAFKGSVIDLAVGIIIGAAFGKIIDSLVKTIIMPLVGVIIGIVSPGNHSYQTWSVTIRGTEVPFGQFISEIVNFLLVALVLFIFIVKFLGWVLHSRKEEAASPPPLTKDQELLTEIRDLLKKYSATERGPIEPAPGTAGGQPFAAP